MYKVRVTMNDPVPQVTRDDPGGASLRRRSGSSLRVARPGQGLAQQPRHGPGDHTNTLYVVTVVTPCTQDQDRADLHSTASTPTPPTAHPGLDTVVKDENGQD